MRSSPNTCGRAIATGYAVGTAENGCAIQMLTVAGASTSARNSARRFMADVTASGVRLTAAAMVVRSGAFVVFTKCS